MRYFSLVFFLIVVMFSLTATQARIIHVPADSSTIQAGINGTVNNDTVLVAPGTYYEHINFNGRKIVLASMFLQSSDTTYISSTKIDGSSNGTVITLTNGEDTTTQIVGFTIQNGFANNFGGLFLNGSSPRIRNNVISGNQANIRAGGIECNVGANAIIENNVFRNNFAGGMGGAITCDVSAPRIIDNMIIENSGFNAVGLLISGGSSAIIKNNVIVNNDADGAGGGIFIDRSNPTIINNTIVGNTANDRGGGMFCNISYPTIVNTIFWGNSCPNGPEIYLTGGSVANITYCDVQGGWSGTGNIDCDPMFCYPDTGNYYLNDSSCCKGAGCDSLGNPDSTVDIGAFGVGCGYVCGDATGNGLIDLGDVVYLITYLYKNGPAPNPLLAGDANCSGEVELGDVVYLISYLYKIGPPPPC